MDKNRIVKETMLKLDGWILKSELEEEGNELTDMDYNKSVDEEEILHFYNVAVNYAQSYTGNYEIEYIPVCSTAIIMWTAGLIWKKYNVRSNSQVDETFTIGYGDSLIIQAKEMLKPYKNYGFYAY